MRVIDVDRTADAVKKNPGLLFGIKVRMHFNAVARWNAHDAMRAARAAADQSGSLLMVHVSGTPIPLPEVLEYLGPGDIATHAFNGNPESMLDGAGKVRPEVRARRPAGRGYGRGPCRRTLRRRSRQSGPGAGASPRHNQQPTFTITHQGAPFT